MPIPTITPLPPAPSRTDPELEFSDDADAFAAALPPLVLQTNATVAGINSAVETVETGAAAATGASSAALGYRNDAQAAAVTALNAPGTIATSVTPLDLETGSQTLIIQAGKSLAEGQYISCAVTGDGSKAMYGPILSYNSVTGSLTFMAETALGTAGNYSSWKVSLSSPASIPVASLSEYWAAVANDKAITPALLASVQSFRALTDAATVSWDILTHGFNVYVVLGGNRTLALPSGIKEGDVLTLQIIQPASGGPYTLTIPASFDLGVGVVPSFSTVANRRDRLRGQVLRVSPALIDATYKKAGA